MVESPWGRDLGRERAIALGQVARRARRPPHALNVDEPRSPNGPSYHLAEALAGGLLLEGVALSVWRPMPSKTVPIACVACSPSA
jgi:hypothetical protein